MNKKLLFPIALAFLLAFSLGSSPVLGDQLDDIMAAGKLVVGSDTTYPPFEFINETTNQAVGFDVDIAKEIGKRMGVSVEIKTVVWDTIIPSLKNGEFDVIISAMTITEERSQEIDFSRPYYNSSQAILVQEGNPKNIKGPEDLNQTGLKIGVQTGTTSDIFISNFTNPEIVRLQNFDDLYLKLNLGEIDVILGDLPVVAYAAATGAVKGEVAATFGSVEQFGIGIRKGETRLLDKINEILNAMLSDGTYDTIYDLWFSTETGTSTPTTRSPYSTEAVFFGFGIMAIFVSIRRKRLI